MSQSVIAHNLTELTRAARDYAANAHDGVNQLRKYTGEPYIVHPEAVAQIVYEHGGDEEMIAAALLHDVVEDTLYTFRDIERDFPYRVAHLVAWLTDRTDLLDGNRRTRKQLERVRWRYAPRHAQIIKMADLLDNAKDIAKNDPKFGVLFFEETQLLWQVLRDSHLHLSLLLREQLMELRDSL